MLKTIDPTMVSPWLVNQSELKSESLPVNKTPRKLVNQVGIAKHDEETCIEEYTDEYAVGDITHLVGFCVASDPIDNHDNNHSKNSVNNNNQIFQKLIHKLTFKGLFSISFANWCLSIISSVSEFLFIFWTQWV